VQEGVVEPVGSNRRVRVDVRIVSSTHRDLEAAIRDGSFREDLYYRLNVFRIQLPPLRERRSDIPELARRFLARFGSDMGKGALELSAEAAERILRYAWPGNVRELRNIMERAAVLADGREIGLRTLELCLPQVASAEGDSESQPELFRAVEEAERRAILRALSATGDNKPGAAARLGIGERTLWTKLKKYGL
jgi:DNA-binding NtrC family response regulator